MQERGPTKLGTASLVLGGIVTYAAFIMGTINDAVGLVKVLRLSGLVIVLGLAAFFFWRESILRSIRQSSRPVLIGGMLAAAFAPLVYATYLLGRDIAIEATDSVDPTVSDLERGEDYSGETIESSSQVGRNLTNSNFTAARLTNVDFDRANLSESSFRNAVLKNVNLAQASLCGADLRGADLRGASNIDVVGDWRFAVYDEETLWPKGFRIEQEYGPIHEWTGSLLLSCNDGTWSVRRLAE